MSSEETGGRTQQFRSGIEHLKKKDSGFAEFSSSYWEKNPQIQKSGLGGDHLDAAGQVTPTSSGLPGTGEGAMLSSGPQPYDPRTNYLSPRPQFLRYDPKRLREIYLRRERELEGAEGDTGLDLGLSEELETSSSEATVSGSALPPSSKREDGLDLAPFQDKGSCESTGGKEDDTAEEERSSCCNLVWKILILLGTSFTIAGYISSMHSFSSLSSLKRFQSFEEDYLKIRCAPRGPAGNIGMNVEKYSRMHMNTCANVHLDGLITAENGISRSSFDGLCKSGATGGDKQQEEGKSMVKEDGDSSVDDVKPSANLAVIGGSKGSVDSGKKLQDETQMAMPEDSDFAASNKDQNDFLVMVEGGGSEYAMYGKENQHDKGKALVVDSYVMVDDKNLNAYMGVVGGGNGDFIRTDKVSDPEREHENRYTRDTVSGEHMEDVMVETEIEETGGAASKLNKPTQAPRGQIISGDDEEEDGEHMEVVMVETEIEETGGAASKLNKPTQPPRGQIISGDDEEEDVSSDNGNRFNLYGMKVVRTVLVVLVFVTSIIFSFRRLKKVKTSVKESSGSFSSCGLASEISSELLTTEKLKESFDTLANTGKSGGYENYPSAVELLKEKFVDSFISTDKSKELHGTHPPTVELLGEFSIAELGFPKTGDSWGRKTQRGNLSHSQYPEISLRNSLNSSDQSPSEFSTTESTPQGNSDQEKLGKKQNNREKQGAVEAVSTPLRRSSRIRNRVASPGA